MNIKNIALATVKLQCGSDRSTAFFITEDKLLTTRHSVADYFINKEPICIELGQNELINCDAEEIQEGLDVVLLTCANYKSTCYLRLLIDVPFQREERYSFFGYSNTIMGELKGLSIDISIHDHFVGNIKDFDTTAIICDTFIPSKFKGFSGSPVYIPEHEIAVGIITNKLDGEVGFLSISAISVILESKNIDLHNDYNKFDNTPYGRFSCKNSLKRMVGMAGHRYERELHQPDNRFKFFNYIWDIEKQKNDITKILEFETSLKDIITQETLDISKYNLSPDYTLLNDENLLGVYHQILFKDIGALYAPSHVQPSLIRKLRENYYSVTSNISLKISPPQFLCIKGLAGVGKTHQMCNLSETLIQNTNVYLCYGTNFNTIDPVKEQIQKIFNFPDSNYLEILNNKANDANKRFFFIIDALNEGAGDDFWQLEISKLILEFKQLNNLILIITIRHPFDRVILSNTTDFPYIVLDGFADVEKAKSSYFKYYNIDEKKVPVDIFEFENCLFLKIFCQTYSQYIEKDKVTYKNLFESYVKIYEHKIAKRIDEDHKKQLATSYIQKIARNSIHSKNCKDVLREDARRISNNLAPLRFWSNSLLKAMLDENLLLEGIDEKDKDTVHFAYERLGDFFKAIVFSEKKNQIKYLKDKLNTLVSIEDNNFEVDNFIIALNVVWYEKYGIELLEDLGLTHSKFIDLFLKSLPLRSSYTHTDYISKLLENYINNEDYSFVFSSFNIDRIEYNSFIDLIHQNLKSLTLSERDRLWTNYINKLDDLDDLESFYSASFVKKVLKSNDESQKKYLIFIIWLLASSHPRVRDRITRIIFYIIKNAPQITSSVLDEFKNVNDLSILERIFCAIYGVTLLSKDKALINEIAKKTHEIIYGKNPPIYHLHLRDWGIRILQRAAYLDSDNNAYYDTALPPYSNIQELPELISVEQLETYLGSTLGSKKIYDSVCGFHDFNRYIIGTNTNTHSRTITTLFIGTDIESVDKNNIPYLPLSNLENYIISEIKGLGWNDRLGELDNYKTSTDGRYDNKTERIGKKYQWLALYSIIPQLLDKYLIIDNPWAYDVQFCNINLPWKSRYTSYFDPTLPVNSLYEPKYPILFNEYISDNITDEPNDTWYQDETNIPSINHLDQIDVNGEKWILLSTHHTKEEKEANGVKKEFFLRYDSAFISNDNKDNFIQWAKEQNFYGRWMPEYHDNIDYLYSEYCWSERYKNSTPELEQEISQGNCPCSVILTTECQLQENKDGTEDEYAGMTLLPNHDIMDIMNLSVSEIRGYIHDENQQIVALYNYLHNGKKGLYIKKSTLDEYLSIKGYSLFYYILGEKNLWEGYNLRSKKLSSAYIYEEGEHREIAPLEIKETI